VQNGAQQDRILGGSQVICLRMAEELGQAVRLNAPVRRIEQSSAGVRVLGEAGAVEGARAIVTAPPALAARIVYDPPMPAYRDQLTQKAPAGSVIKCMVIFDSPFWRDQDLTGQVGSDTGPVKVTFDNSPPDGSPGVLLVFLEGNAARELGRASFSDRRQAVLRCLARYFDDRALSPRDYLDKDWSADEWTRGCYGAHFPPGVWTAFGPALSQPVGHIHWAGAETATVWNGYMDGAVQSGERAAAECLAALA
jgi:monoamine oxidase